MVTKTCSQTPRRTLTERASSAALPCPKNSAPRFLARRARPSAPASAAGLRSSVMKVPLVGSPGSRPASAPTANSANGMLPVRARGGAGGVTVDPAPAAASSAVAGRAGPVGGAVLAVAAAAGPRCCAAANRACEVPLRMPLQAINYINQQPEMGRV